MKVKQLKNLLYKLQDDEDVVLLNDAAPMSAVNEIATAAIVQMPTDPPQKPSYADADKSAEYGDVCKNRLVLMYSTRERSDRK